MTSINLHDCISAEVVQHDRQRNALVLRVLSDGAYTDLVLYGLPADATARIKTGFGIRDPKVVALESVRA